MNRRDYPAFERVRTLGLSPAVGKSPNEAWRNGLEALKLNHEKLIKETSSRREQDRKKWAEMDSKRKRAEVKRRESVALQMFCTAEATLTSWASLEMRRTCIVEETMARGPRRQ